MSPITAIFKAAASKDQKAWLSAAEKVKHFETYPEWRQKHQITDVIKSYELYLDDWERTLPTEATIISTRNVDKELGRAIARRLAKVNKFGLEAADAFEEEFENKLISDVTIDHGSLKLKHCAIRRLHCWHGASVTLVNCWVGLMQIGENSLNYFEIRGGNIARLESPLPGQLNPFRGSASIVDAKFDSLLENAQAFRNMRHHLSAIHNQEAAAVFHSAEMRTLFGQQNKLDKIFNLIYRGISDYGNSTTRPLWLFSAFALINFAIFFATDGAVVSGDVANTGWQLALHEGGWAGDALRSATITLTQIVNPLGIFGVKTIVTAKSISLVISNLVICLAATVSLGFFVFALRRRFRLAQE